MNSLNDIELVQNSADLQSDVNIDNKAYTHGNNPRPRTVSVSESNDTSMGKKKQPYFLKWLVLTGQACMLCFSFLIVYCCLCDELVLFTWHPLLMGSVWLISMTQAILIITKQDYLTDHLTHKQRVQYHWILQSVGVSFCAVAFIAVVVNKFKLDKHHFKTWHALFGLIGFILCAVACLSGATTLYCAKFKEYISPKFNKYIHICAGVCTYTFAGLSFILSVYSNWFSKRIERREYLFSFGLLISIFLIVVTLVKPVMNLLKRPYQFCE